MEELQNLSLLELHQGEETTSARDTRLTMERAAESLRVAGVPLPSGHECEEFAEIQVKRECAECKQLKPASDYYEITPGRTTGSCKVCVKKYAQKEYGGKLFYETYSSDLTREDIAVYNHDRTMFVQNGIMHDNCILNPSPTQSLTQHAIQVTSQLAPDLPAVICKSCVEKFEQRCQDAAESIKLLNMTTSNPPKRFVISGYTQPSSTQRVEQIIRQVAPEMLIETRQEREDPVRKELEQFIASKFNRPPSPPRPARPADEVYIGEEEACPCCHGN